MNFDKNGFLEGDSLTETDKSIIYINDSKDQEYKKILLYGGIGLVAALIIGIVVAIYINSVKQKTKKKQLKVVEEEV